MSDGPARLALHLRDIGADAERIDARSFVVRVPTERRGPFAVGLRVGERTLNAEAFFMRAPDRHHGTVYRRLLAKNMGPGRWRFAVDDDGDLFMVLRTPLAALTAGDLDEMLGELSVTVDESFDGIMRLGFDVPALVTPPPANPPD